MRLERPALARLLGSVTKAVQGRNTIPILATVRLVSDGQQLTITATDLDVEISGAIPAEGTIKACVDAKLFAAAIGKIAGTEVELAAEENTLIVKAGRSRFKLATLPVDDFPTMAVGEFTAEFETDAAALFAPVAFSMSDEQTRYYLCGAYLEPTAITATNGHKLSTVKHELPAFGLARGVGVIVPSATVALAPKGNGTVRLSDTKIQFVADGVTLTSKLVEGSFPDYERVIPKNNERAVVVDGAALKAAVERVAVVGVDRSPGIKLSIANDEITLTATGEGEASDVVPCTYAGDAIEIGFAAKYLVEIVANMPAGAITMHLQDGGSPALFTSPVKDGLRSVLMPRRV